MTHNDLIWIADRELQIISLSARLQNLLFPQGSPAQLHVSDLWHEDDPFGMMLVAHQWVLEGERIAFDTERNGLTLHIVLEPLYDLSGAITGVGGCATPGVGGGQSSWEVETLEEVERICGFGTWRTDLRTGRRLWSAGLYAILGLDEGTPPGQLRRFDHPEDMDAIADAIREGEIGGKGYRVDHRIVRTDGTTRYVQEQAHVLYDDAGTAIANVGSVVDITDRKAAEARLAQLAHYDPVSKLPNRTLLEQRLHSSLSRAQTDGSGCAVLFLDVDDFKRVNDTYGHAAGDELLAAIGTRLNHHVRAGDTVARMSGDEFVVVLSGLAGREDAITAARKILRSFEVPFHLTGTRDCRVGVSIGVAIYPESRVSAKTLIDVADREMYTVKRNGGRGIKVAPAQECSEAEDENEACATSSAGRSPLRIVANG
jgi:diguanylate cyclase (GGDEF)-like protein/PAS domain S-box-containing protein